MRYGIVGLVSTAVNYAIFISAIALGVHYLVAATLGSAITVIIGYYLNRSYTFASREPATAFEFASFVAVFGVQYALAMGGYALLVGYFRINVSIAFVLISVFLFCVAFTLLKSITFRRSA
jgi:putative flippase GtrA